MEASCCVFEGNERIFASGYHEIVDAFLRSWQSDDADGAFGGGEQAAEFVNLAVDVEDGRAFAVAIEADADFPPWGGEVLEFGDEIGDAFLP